MNVCCSRIHFRLYIHVLVLPLPPLIDFVLTGVSDGVVIRPAIELSFLNQFLVDERVEVRIESAVINFGAVVLLDFIFDFLAGRLVSTRDHVQEIALEAGEVGHLTREFNEPVFDFFSD